MVLLWLGASFVIHPLFVLSVQTCIIYSQLIKNAIIVQIMFQAVYTAKIKPVALNVILVII